MNIFNYILSLLYIDFDLIINIMCLEKFIFIECIVIVIFSYDIFLLYRV